MQARKNDLALQNECKGGLYTQKLPVNRTSGHYVISYVYIVEVRDSRTGYLIPARDGPGALSDMDSSWDVAAAAAVSQNVTLISFSFRA